ncbi:MAG: DNA-processing protein DprA, partial [Betaproteobacteria bacterium]
ATPAGQRLAGRLAAELAVLGVEVVSGLAVGIDAAAHEATLNTGGPGSTIAVVASGLDEVYPRQHRVLFHRIAEAGLVVSEHPLGTPALPAYFPQRNRIIAGLSCAVVVVEATLRSGSLITARLASEAGRDVFAVPGPLSSAQSAGCNRLIKSGAGLLEHVGDIVESQPWAFSPAVRQAVAPPGRRQKRPDAAAAGLQPTGPGGLSPPSWSRVSRMLRAKPCDLPELASAVSESASAVSHTLLMAELQGLVARVPGSLYQWCGET